MKVNSGAGRPGAQRTQSAARRARSAARRTQAQRTAATRAVLLASARKLFADKGFAHVSTEAIVKAAGVSRGALYHQFSDKSALFAEVYEEVERDIVADIVDRIVAADPSDPVEAMRLGVRLFLDRCAAPDVARIVLIDAPVVLGWDRWRAVGVKYGLGVIEGMLARAVEAGAIPEQPLRPSAHVLLGALDEAALYVSRAADADRAKQEMYEVCDRILHGIAAAR
jgi:AcrR family transcriptional regulator